MIPKFVSKFLCVSISEIRDTCRLTVGVAAAMICVY